jgi:hypothetical protein
MSSISGPLLADGRRLDGSLAGVLAFWSVIHVPDHAVPGALIFARSPG